MEKKVKAVADTDFLSAFFKIKRLSLIFRALNVDEIFITGAVLHELEESAFYGEFLELLEMGRIVVKETKKIEPFNDLGEGELESISLAENANSILLMDDRIAGKSAKTKGIAVIDIPKFLLDCKNKNIVSSKEMKQIIKDLKGKDYYEFTKEVEHLLLN